MTARDPRKDPRPGDVLRSGDGFGSFTIHVRGRDYGSKEVLYQEDGWGEMLRCYIDDWREDAENDVVVRRAEDR